AAALFLLETAAGRSPGEERPAPLGRLALLFGVAGGTSALLWTLLYPEISPSLAFEATVAMPARLISDGSRYMAPMFHQGLASLVIGIPAGAALFAATVAWAFALEETRARRIVSAAIVAGGILPFLVLFSKKPARWTGLLAVLLLLLTGLAVFAGRRGLKGSAALRASATLGVLAAAFGHYYWARSDDAHLAPLLTLALAGAALCLPALRTHLRAAVIGVFVFLYATGMRPFFFPAAKLAKADV